MNTCWKCGADLPEGQTECDRCIGEVTDQDVAELEADKADFERNWAEIDWDKVTTLEDLILVLKYCDPQFVYKLTPGFKRIKKFTKPSDND
jgi:predicted amidophosphoribosyltransferase